MLEAESKAFAEESRGMAALIAPLSEEEWLTPSQFTGWTIDDVITHLHVANIAAIYALTDPDAYLKRRNEIEAAAAANPASSSPLGSVQYHRERLGNIPSRALFDAWTKTCEELVKVYATADGKQRVTWVRRTMSARSCISARLMEHWAHGQEIYDQLGVERQFTDHLFHVATLGVNTFNWSFSNRKMAVPPVRPEVRLVSPSGKEWQWPATNGCPDLIEGQAHEFCQVATQTRNIADTKLKVSGPVAVSWMQYAQCFGGPPVLPPAPGTRFTQRRHPSSAGASK